MEQFYINKGTDYNSCLIAGSLQGLRHSLSSKTRSVVGGDHHCAKVVYQFEKNGVFIRKHFSIIDALKHLGKNKSGSSHITQCCIGNVYSSFGFRWSFSETLNSRDNRLGKKIIKVSLEDSTYVGTYVDVVNYFKSKGYLRARVSTLTNALNRNIRIYKHKIELYV